MAQTSDGYLWIGSARGLFRFDGIAFERFRPADGSALPSHNIYALAATRDGGLWISFRPSGVGYVKQGVFESFTRAGEVPDGPIFALATQEERVWAATLSGLELRDGGSWIPIGPEWGVPRERVWCLFVNRLGTLWVATKDRLFSLARGQRAFRSEGPHQAGNVRGMAETPDGELWLCGTQSVRPAVAAAGRPSTPVPIESGCAHLLFDRDGGAWAASTRGGFYRMTRHTGEAEAYGERDGLSGTR